MESLIAFSIKNGKFFNFLAFVFTILGIVVFVTARKDFIPPVKEAKIVVSVIYPGASPESVREEIVSIIEEKTSEVPEIAKSSSVSKKNIGIVTLDVKRANFYELQTVLQKVKDKVDAIEFPEIAQKPQITVYDFTEDMTILALHTTAPYDISRNLELALRQLDGLKAIKIVGREDYRYTIQFNPERLANMGISLAESAYAIQQAIPDIPGGETLKEGLNRNISVHSSFDSIEEIENIVIRVNENLHTIYLKDLATVIYEPKKNSSIHRLDGRNGIVFNLSKTKDKDILRFTEETKYIVNEFTTSYPQYDFTFFLEDAVAVESRLSLLNSNLSYGLILVFIILIIYMNFITSFWTAMGIPVSFAIGAIISVCVFGVTINIISMIGFIVVLGIVVDDAIICAENSYRLIEEGYTPYDAVVKGMSEVLVSIVFAILTTVGTILCMLFLGGKIGDMTEPLVIVFTVTVIASLFEAIFILPSHLVNSFERRISPKAWRDRFFNIFYYPYRQLLGVLLKYRKTSFIVFVVFVFGTTTILFSKVPFVFFGGPPTFIHIEVQSLPGTPVKNSADFIKPIENILKANDNLEHVYSIVGVDGDSHRMKIRANIKTDVSPREDWNQLKSQILDTTQNNSNITDTRFYVMREDSMATDLVNITVKGTDNQAVQDLANEVRQEISLYDNVQNPRLSISESSEEIKIILDPQKIYAYGLTPRKVAEYISMAFEGTAARTLVREGKEVDLYLQYSTLNQSLEALSNLTIPNKYARFVSFSSIAEITTIATDSEITTEDGLFAIHVLDTLQNVDVLSNNAYEIQGKAQQIFNTKGDSRARVFFDNDQKEINDSLRQMLAVSVLAVLIIFASLLFMFNSYRHSFIILFAIPFMGLGITFGLFIMNLPLTNMALAGSIALLGMIVNDGIVILEFLRTHIHKGTDFIEDVINGASMRLRSIMMTTSTTVFGIMPVAFGFAGNEFFLQPLAVAMMFGILFNSLITLILIPLTVTIFELDLKNAFTKGLKNSYIWVIFAIIPTLSYAQTNIITEQDFLERYLQKGFDLEIHKTSSNQSISLEKGAFLPYSPSLYAQGGYLAGQTVNPLSLDDITAMGQPLSTNTTLSYTNFSVSGGVESTIYPSGTYLQIGGGVDFLNTDIPSGDLATMSFTNARNAFTAPYLRVGIVQPLLKDGFAYNMHKKRVNLSKRDARVSLLQEQIRLEESTMNILQQFHSLILNLNILSIRKESLNRINNILTTQKKLQAVGARSAFDVRQIEMQEILLDAGVNSMTLSLDNNFSELESKLDMELDRTNLIFLDSSAVLEFDRAFTYEIAKENNTDLAKVRVLSEKATDFSDIQKNQSLPELNLSAYYKYGEFNSDIVDDLYIGLQFKIPLAYNLEIAKKREMSYQAQKAKLEVQNYERELRYMVDKLLTQWDILQNDIHSKEKLSIVSSRVSNEAYKRWNSSEISLMELFTHEENYRQAQIELAIRKYEQKQLALQLSLLRGDLLERYGIIESN